MVGFIKGFFSRKKDDSDDAKQARPAPEVREKAAKKALSYFLDADSAQSMGNVDYMRTTRSVRRTFPKTLGSPEELETNVEISSLKKAAKTGAPIIVTSVSEPTTPTIDPSVDRRRKDTSMDMFRNMAKDIRKN